MWDYHEVTDEFVKQSTKILGDKLTGVYLHGSATMGCFNPKESDIDLLVVVKDALSTGEKRQFMDMVVELNKKAPKKGIEMSIVKESVCNPFVYPTPFELHFSIAHLDWYLSNPQEYVEKMNGTDKDLAAHFTIIYYRGIKLYGGEIASVFFKVSRADYLDSIWSDVENAEEEINENPMYIILNLCRVLAYAEEGQILSKQEGGIWGMDHIPVLEYKNLVREALEEYQTGEAMVLEAPVAEAFAAYMLERIRTACME